MRQVDPTIQLIECGSSNAQMPTFLAEAPHLIEETYDVQDAVVFASLLMSLPRHADRGTIACPAQLVDVMRPSARSRMKSVTVENARMSAMPPPSRGRCSASSRADRLNWSTEVSSVQACLITYSSTASADPRAQGTRVAFADPTCASGQEYTLTAYMDGSILELFTSGGKCATVRMCPTTKPPWKLIVGDVQGRDVVSSREV